MASYRFCRTDDVPLLVEAYESCYRVWFPELPELTAEGYKRWARTLDVWASSCMVAQVGREVVAVLLATKRDAEAIVWAVGTKPGHERQGHASHLLDSLASKLAILGPPRLVAEVPEHLGAARALFEHCGYAHERTLTDWQRDPGGTPPAGAELVVETSWAELLAQPGLPPPRARCHERSAATLAKRKHEIAALVVSSGDRVEAWLAYDPSPSPAWGTVLGFAAADPGREAVWGRLLVERLASSSSRPLRFPRVDPGEVDAAALGFRPAGNTLVVARGAGGSRVG
jgi:ribosomal protein S18 acetylase RimI-like enzyme